MQQSRPFIRLVTILLAISLLANSASAGPPIRFFAPRITPRSTYVPKSSYTPRYSEYSSYSIRNTYYGTHPALRDVAPILRYSPSSSYESQYGRAYHIKPHILYTDSDNYSQNRTSIIINHLNRQYNPAAYSSLNTNIITRHYSGIELQYIYAFLKEFNLTPEFKRLIFTNDDLSREVIQLSRRAWFTDKSMKELLVNPEQNMHYRTVAFYLRMLSPDALTTVRPQEPQVLPPPEPHKVTPQVEVPLNGPDDPAQTALLRAYGYLRTNGTKRSRRAWYRAHSHVARAAGINNDEVAKYLEERAIQDIAMLQKLGTPPPADTGDGMPVDAPANLPRWIMSYQAAVGIRRDGRFSPSVRQRIRQDKATLQQAQYILNKDGDMRVSVARNSGRAPRIAAYGAGAPGGTEVLAVCPGRSGGGRRGGNGGGGGRDGRGSSPEGGDAEPDPKRPDKNHPERTETWFFSGDKLVGRMLGWSFFVNSAAYEIPWASTQGRYFLRVSSPILTPGHYRVAFGQTSVWIKREELDGFMAGTSPLPTGLATLISKTQSAPGSKAPIIVVARNSLEQGHLSPEELSQLGLINSEKFAAALKRQLENRYTIMVTDSPVAAVRNLTNPLRIRSGQDIHVIEDNRIITHGEVNAIRHTLKGTGKEFKFLRLGSQTENEPAVALFVGHQNKGMKSVIDSAIRKGKLEGSYVGLAVCSDGPESTALVSRIIREGKARGVFYFHGEVKSWAARETLVEFAGIAAKRGFSTEDVPGLWTESVQNLKTRYIASPPQIIDLEEIAYPGIWTINNRRPASRHTVATYVHFVRG